jgi:hypothetical protein
MHPRKPPPDSVLARAAEARAEGNSWKVVGEIVSQSEHTVRKWPRVYPDRWEAATRAADRRVIDAAAAEGVCVLRQLIRSLDNKIKLKAAWHLIYQRLELAKIELQAATALAAPPAPSDAQLIAAFVEAQPRDQLIKLAANLLNARVPKRITVSGDEAAGGG